MRDTGIMIEVRRLDGRRYWINPHQIESISANPDVTLQMLSGKAVVVGDTPEEIIQKIIAYRRRIGAFGNED
jgi:flagellar protein FlbD